MQDGSISLKRNGRETANLKSFPKSYIRKKKNTKEVLNLETLIITIIKRNCFRIWVIWGSCQLAITWKNEEAHVLVPPQNTIVNWDLAGLAVTGRSHQQTSAPCLLPYYVQGKKLGGKYYILKELNTQVGKMEHRIYRWKINITAILSSPINFHNG